MPERPVTRAKPHSFNQRAAGSGKQVSRLPSSGAFGQQRNIRYFALAFSVTRVQPHAQLSPCYFTAAFGKPARDDVGTCIGNAAQGKLSDQFIDVIERASKGDIMAGNEIEDPKFMTDLLNFILVMDSCGIDITMQ
ncbi:hypothetical protein R6H00_04380 [Actinotignum timonense]|uniref:hypothetical protein n=1 Tax=Actinotignum timonense TaxID=1870995 RepID=UPI002A841BE1|nr:hypothetical protein [Actinotignum timonense]MDY5138430.1 hypothetical protein [Actinotignum timonense]